ncbi:MAG: queuosine precursor transporter [Legionellales bacterium]|nr:queuosine precursor transporter [Legionellales bacterium]
MKNTHQSFEGSTARPKEQYKFCSFLFMIYLTALLGEMVIGYRMAVIDRLIVSGSAFIVPITYFIGDIVAEVYGYKLARKMIWSALICEVLFVCALNFVVLLPHLENVEYQYAYSVLVPPMLRSTLTDLVTIFSSEFINIFFISKWKILTRGRFYWIRSTCSTTISVFAFSAIACIIAYSGVYTLKEIINSIFSSYIICQAIIILLSFFGIFIVAYLKRVENVDVFDIGVNFNPFARN